MNPSSEPRAADFSALSSNTPQTELRIESFVSGPLQTNTFLLIDTGAKCAVVIDPSIQSDAALARALALQEEGIRFEAIWNTHGHFDHVYDNARWKKSFDVPIYAHQDDEFFLENLREQAIWFSLPAPEVVATDRFIRDGDHLQVGEFSCEVLSLPGHSPGSVGFYFAAQGLCIGGDVLFQGSVGRTDLPASSEADLAHSLRRLFALPPQTQILTGHGAPTTLEVEIRTNAIAHSLLSHH